MIKIMFKVMGLSETFTQIYWETLVVVVMLTIWGALVDCMIFPGGDGRPDSAPAGSGGLVRGELQLVLRGSQSSDWQVWLYILTTITVSSLPWFWKTILYSYDTRTVILTVWSHLLQVGLQLVLVILALVFLSFGPLRWNIFSIGPLNVIAVREGLSGK